MTNTFDRENAISVGLLIMRFGFGVYLLTHGVGKLEMLMNGQFEQFGDPIGLGNQLSLTLVTFAEFVCAILVIIGLATRFASIPVVINMAVAAFVAHGSDPWTMTEAANLFMSGQSESWASKEPALLYLTPFLGFIFTGAGRFSLDEIIRRRRARGHQQA